tara:strand:- start:227 stop:619 length:393 start_codon:yes stop_codon:yes gene_type:complete
VSSPKLLQNSPDVKPNIQQSRMRDLLAYEHVTQIEGSIEHMVRNAARPPAQNVGEGMACRIGIRGAHILRYDSVIIVFTLTIPFELVWRSMISLFVQNATTLGYPILTSSRALWKDGIQADKTRLMLVGT